MILGIDTTTDWSSVALGDESLVWRGDRNQSKELLLKIEKIMKKCKIGFDDLTGVVVVNGPGSYTGIRIGVSVANTIGMLKNIPVKGVDGLVAQVSSFKFQVSSIKSLVNARENIISLISAGGRRVYGKKYQILNFKYQTNNKKEGQDFFVGEVEEFLGDENKEIYIIGEVNEEVENWIKSSGFSYFELLNEKDKYGRAWGAVKLWGELPTVKNNNVIPLYLREAVRK